MITITCDIFAAVVVVDNGKSSINYSRWAKLELGSDFQIYVTLFKMNKKIMTPVLLLRILKELRDNKRANVIPGGPSVATAFET